MLSSDRMHCPSYEARVTALNKRAAANRANAQLSTGPKTPAGKAAIALDNLRHGLAGAFLILPTENEEDFAAPLENLLDEHQPATETERLLVTNMARHQWLSDPALKTPAAGLWRSRRLRKRRAPPALSALPNHPSARLP